MKLKNSICLKIGFISEIKQTLLGNYTCLWCTYVKIRKKIDTLLVFFI